MYRHTVPGQVTSLGPNSYKIGARRVSVRLTPAGQALIIITCIITTLYYYHYYYYYVC